MSHSGHFKQVCKECGTVVSQCRCPALDKRVDMVVCDVCLHKTKPDQAPMLTNNEGNEQAHIVPIDPLS